jgi:hypothetical protein
MFVSGLQEIFSAFWRTRMGNFRPEDSQQHRRSCEKRRNHPVSSVLVSSASPAELGGERSHSSPNVSPPARDFLGSLHGSHLPAMPPGKGFFQSLARMPRRMPCSFALVVGASKARTEMDPKKEYLSASLKVVSILFSIASCSLVRFFI